jgi:LPXTG-motif cell wall-anchored protein
MKLRGLASVTAATATAFLFVGALGAPAFATPDPTIPVTFALDIPEAGTTAAQWKTNGCDGVPGGAKAGIDGWVFDQPIPGVTDDNARYIFGLLAADGTTPWVFGVDKDGVFAFDLNSAAMKAFKAGGKAALKSAAPKIAAQTMGGVTPPVGVAGMGTAAGAWLQTPKGWTLEIGLELAPDNAEVGEDQLFNLLRTCLPPAASQSAPASVPASVPASAPAGGVGGGGGLPVTGTNIWLIAGTGSALLLTGGVLFVLRRRRESVKFVA